MNLTDILAKNSRYFGSRTALVEIKPVSKERLHITWRGLYERTNALANSLLERGVGPEDRVFLLGYNAIAWLEAFFGVMKTGACVVPLNFRFTDQELSYCAGIARPKAFIYGPEFAGRMPELRQRIPAEHFICLGPDASEGETLEKIIDKGNPEDPALPLGEEARAGLYFTSGTTGKPKPVLMLHKNLMSAAVSEAHNHQLTFQDSLLMMPPFYHLAIGHLTGLMLVGGRGVLLTEQISAQTIVQTLSAERISEVFLLVPWALDILEAFDKGELIPGDFDLSAWRLTHMGAQPIPPVLVSRLKSYFPEMRYDTNYGLSESAGPGVVHLGLQNAHKVGAIGRPGLMWDARIVDLKDRDVGQGEVGELIVKGPGVMPEYYGNPELTAQTIRDQWLYTGDMARFDEDGFIWLVDRKKDLVISGGENIFPLEIEEVIIRHPRVFDVAVIGTPDQRLGEVATAIIQATEGKSLTTEEIEAFCAKELARYKRPRRIIFDQVPRNSTGKLDKPALRRKYAAGT